MSQCLSFFFQAEDGIRDLVRSRGLGDVYKRQTQKAYERSVPKWLASGKAKAHRVVGIGDKVDLGLSLIHI